jgi:hypothetical protein
VQSSAVIFVFTKLFLVEVRSVSDSASLGAVESDRLDGEGEVDGDASLDDAA